MGSPHWLASSIGKKAIVAATGFVLFLFVLGHLAGNLQIFLGRDALNAYAEKLRHLGPLLWAVRAFLLAALAVHVALSVKLSLENRAARPVAYVRRRNVRASPASRTMLLTGLLVFAFIVYHLLHFTLFAVRPEYARLTDGAGRHDVYAMVVLSFRNPAVSAAYAAAMAVLALHLSHAVASMAQTWGFAEGRLAGLRGAGAAVSWAIFAGYVSIPAACLLGWVPLPAGAGS